MLRYGRTRWSQVYGSVKRTTGLATSDGRERRIVNLFYFVSSFDLGWLSERLRHQRGLAYDLHMTIKLHLNSFVEYIFQINSARTNLKCIFYLFRLLVSVGAFWQPSTPNVDICLLFDTFLATSRSSMRKLFKFFRTEKIWNVFYLYFDSSFGLGWCCLPVFVFQIKLQWISFVFVVFQMKFQWI